MTGFDSKRAAAADKLHWSDCAVHNGPAYPAGECDCGAAQPWNEDEWRRNNWRCHHGWLRGEQCEICNAAQPAQEPVAHLWECLGRWSAYLVENGKQADCAPPSWLVDAINKATTPPLPEQEPVAYSSVAYKLAQKELGRLVAENFGRMPRDKWADSVLDLRDHLESQPSQEPVAFDAFLQSKDFYELMQTYRHFQTDAIKPFEAVKNALRAAHNIKKKNI